MKPNDIKEIIRVVVDYGWPFLVKVRRDADGKLTGEEDRFTVLDILLDYIRTYPVRLDPTHEWDWPIETRDGMPVWWRRAYADGDGIPHSQWRKGLFTPIGLMCFETGLYSPIPTEAEFAAPHPLNPNEPPPADWTVEGRRVLK